MSQPEKQTMQKLKYFIPKMSQLLNKELDMMKFHQECTSVYPRMSYAMELLHALKPNVTGPFNVADIHMDNFVRELTRIRFIPEVMSRDEFVANWLKDIDSAYDLFTWLVLNREKVKVRFYLANFVDCVYVPDQFQEDPLIKKALEVNKELMNMFWLIYNNYKVTEKELSEWQEVQNDLKTMRNEANNLTKRIETQSEKLLTIPNNKTLTTHAKIVSNCNFQKNKLENEIQTNSEQIKRMESKWAHFNRFQTSENPQLETIIPNLRENLNTSQTLLNTSVKVEKNKVGELNITLKQVLDGPTDNENLFKKLHTMQEVVQKLTSEKISLHNAEDDKLNPFRKQAAGVANRKETLSKNISSIRNRHIELSAELKEKEDYLHKTVGGEIYHGERLKRFISELRGKSVVYKSKREQLQYWLSESALINRSTDILRSFESTLSDVQPERKTPPKKPSISETNQIKSIDEARLLSKSLMLQLEGKRSGAALNQNRLLRCREEFYKIRDQYEKVKANFDDATKSVANRVETLKENAASKTDQIEILENQWKTNAMILEKIDQVYVQLVDEVLEARTSEGMIKPTYKERLDEKLEELQKDLDGLNWIIHTSETRRNEVLAKIKVYKALEQILSKK
ncbi:intraflagellar transport protein 81 homolog [Onthophagus taurus]|uniref:intraflagellar transport protein 81 homolog n=1 Tax=Onthophagus taurus TaxID=166361 RepID=UPI0039BE195E